MIFKLSRELCHKSTVKDRTGSVLHQYEGGIGKSIPDAQEISEIRKISRGGSPREILRVEGNLEGRGDEFPNNS